MATTIKKLREAASHCKGCDLYKHATQTVFGEGSDHPEVVLVGEQPGNAEDLAGRPFVGPAGRILDQVLTAAGFDRSDIYITNAVKHFKNQPLGKLRLHKRPNQEEVRACRPWFEAEIEVLQPDLVICLGATAASLVLGKAVKIGEVHGQIRYWESDISLMVTYHPSAVLRQIDPVSRRRMFDQIRADLVSAREFIEKKVRAINRPA